jgi:SagB-type dehydrogenase family enzyme
MMRLKRASCQIAYWQDGQLRLSNYLTARTFSTNSLTLELMHFFGAPRTIKDALDEFRVYSRGSVASAILRLIKAQLLLEYGSAEWKRDELVGSSWRRWLPEGGFHFMTKDVPYVTPDSPIEERLRSLPTTPAPPQFKKIRGARMIRLPAREIAADSFFETLHARRTHREFARGKVLLESVATLLQTTWGVQGYFDAEAFGKLPYKTSPSGGARHPGEVYLMALRVAGLERGMYHYQARDNRLARLPVKVSPRLASWYCGDQSHFARAAALFIMTAVFARSMWKYGRARAYRVVLLDAGHLCQTFCLTATRLGLAPFSTAALKDSVIEEDLGIDGITESVLYVAGVGLATERAYKDRDLAVKTPRSTAADRARASRRYAVGDAGTSRLPRWRRAAAARLLRVSP